jgi:hypothetical protein
MSWAGNGSHASPAAIKMAQTGSRTTLEHTSRNRSGFSLMQTNTQRLADEVQLFSARGKLHEWKISLVRQAGLFWYSWSVPI